MTRISLWLIAATASIGLAAGQATQDKPKSKYFPFEVQIGGSFMGYESHNASFTPPGKDTLTTTFSPKNARLSPSVRLSIDPICLPFGSIVLSAGYRFKNDVPLQYWQDAYADLRHESQVQFGIGLRFDPIKNFEFGIAVDTRNDWMYAGPRRGTDSESTGWRPWARAHVRYMFDNWKNITPFIGVEGAIAMSKGPNKIDPTNYYLDYVNNTGDDPLNSGYPQNPNTPRSPDSFARGHFPNAEVAVVAGFRFGRHGCKSGAAKPVAEPKPPKEPKPLKEAKPPKVEQPKPPVVEQPKPPVAEPKLVIEPPITEPPKPPVVDDRERMQREQIEREARERATRESAVVEVEELIIHFYNNHAQDDINRTIVRNWVAKYKNVIDPNTLIITGHTDRTGSWNHNQTLSLNRARTLASYLRAEGINVPAQNVVGRSFDEPRATNDTAEGRAKNRRAEVRIKNGSKFRIKPAMEGQLLGIN